MSQVIVLEEVQHQNQKKYPDRKITSITYNGPIFERADPNSYFNENEKPMRFAVSGDPVSMFDMNARTTFKAPELNLESIKIQEMLQQILHLII